MSNNKENEEKFEEKKDDIKEQIKKMQEEIEELRELIEEVEDEVDEEFEDIDFEDPIFRQFEELLGDQVLVITEAQQLNLLGQTFRPIFCGPIVEVEPGHITLYPATIKILNAPFFKFPTPLSIPMERIAQFTPNFDCDERIPLV